MPSQAPSIEDLWHAFNTDEKLDACVAFWVTKEPECRRLHTPLLRQLAAAMRFRPVFLERKTPQERGKYLTRWIDSPEFRMFYDDLIRAWLVENRRKLLCAFLDALGVEHDRGFVDDKVSPPSPELLAKAVTAIQGGFLHRDLVVYFGYLQHFGGDFWVSLPSAVGIAGFDFGLAAVSGHELTTTPVEGASQPDIQPEQSEEFTTLDNILIRTLVASAFREEGALSPDQAEELVEEAVELNASVQRRLFHRGFLHALFERPFTFHFPGENLDRRIWYFTGVLFGLLRRGEQERLVELVRTERELTNQLSTADNVKCGAMLLPHLLGPLWDAEEFGILQHLISNQILRIPVHSRISVVMQLHYSAAALLRKNRWTEAILFLEIVNDALSKGEDWPRGFVEQSGPMNQRKQAQALQLQGDFGQAEEILQEIVALPNFEDAPNGLADLALIRSGFRALPDILPAKARDEATAIQQSLSKSEDLLQEAVDEHGTAATNAHLMLGVLRVLRGDTATAEAADHFKTALVGMLKKESAYLEAGVIQWTRFLLGLSLLETINPSEYQNARERVQQSFSVKTPFPIWLWERALSAAAFFTDPGLAREIADHLLKTRGTDANEAIWNAGLPLRSKTLRSTYIDWLTSGEHPAKVLWSQLTALLPATIKQCDYRQSEVVLDALEGVAEQGGEYRSAFIDILGDDKNYSPAWDRTDAENVLIRLYELEGRLPEAAEYLRSRFFRLREQSDPASLHDAKLVLDRIDSYRLDTSDTAPLRNLLPVAAPDPDSRDRLLRGAPIYIIYAGGNEMQKAYEPMIRKELGAEYPGLKVDFFYPGWGSKWSSIVERINSLLSQADALVLSTMVRTHFGRYVRSSCTSATPWFPCTGRGKRSIKSSIEEAALWAVGNR